MSRTDMPPSLDARWSPKLGDYFIRCGDNRGWLHVYPDGSTAWGSPTGADDALPLTVDAQSLPSDSQAGHSGTDGGHVWQRAEPGEFDSCSRCGRFRFAYYAHAERRPCGVDSGTDEDAYAGVARILRATGREPIRADDEDDQAIVDAALAWDRERTAEMLRLAASGRRRYARTPHSYAEHLEHEAVLLDLAADVVAGDLTPMQSWLPSWMWTDEIREAGRG